MNKLYLIIVLSCAFKLNFAQTTQPLSYEINEARQGVAVDSTFFYVVNNSSITKYKKSNGEVINMWNENNSAIQHLNSGVVIDGILYCTNSNYPDLPMASSIEMFDAYSLKHVDNHSFGIFNGSATWIDFYNEHWYVVFAHYSKLGGNTANTRMVKFDKEWRQIESWIFPKNVIEVFGNMSNSGGFIHPNGIIYCTGHDNHEIYKLKFPKKGYTLIYDGTISFGGYGQGIAYDVINGKEMIWGIIKKENKIVVSQLE